MHIDLETPRPLRDDERAVIVAILPKGSSSTHGVSLDNAYVIDLQDGGMGSIRFVISGQRHRASAIAEAQCEDEDGILVTIELSADEAGELFELDIWKVDFTRLKRFPRPRDLKIVR